MLDNVFHPKDLTILTEDFLHASHCHSLLMQFTYYMQSVITTKMIFHLYPHILFTKSISLHIIQAILIFLQHIHICYQSSSCFSLLQTMICIFFASSSFLFIFITIDIFNYFIISLVFFFFARFLLAIISFLKSYKCSCVLIHYQSSSYHFSV